jgi:hypothetical protein
MDSKRLIITGGELRDYPGHWKLSGRVDGEPGEWSVLRKPDGTYWEVVAEHLFPPTGGTCRVDTGDQIVDSKIIAECEAYYTQLRQKAAE